VTSEPSEPATPEPVNESEEFDLKIAIHRYEGKLVTSEDVTVLFQDEDLEPGVYHLYARKENTEVPGYLSERNPTLESFWNHVGENPP